MQNIANPFDIASVLCKILHTIQFMKASQQNLVAVQVRLPRDLAEFVENMAKAQFNTNGGIVRMAVAKLKESQEQAKKESEPTAA